MWYAHTTVDSMNMLDWTGGRGCLVLKKICQILLVSWSIISAIIILNNSTMARGHQYNPLVRIKYVRGNLTSHGTGCVIKHDGNYIILTANHVLDGHGQIKIQTAAREDVDCTVRKLVRMPEYDIAAIYIGGVRFKTFQILLDGTSGDSVVVLGFPEDGELKKSVGKVYNIQMMSTCEIISGMSGAPILQDNRLLGVTLAKTKASKPDGSVVMGGSHTPIRNILLELNKDVKRRLRR